MDHTSASASPANEPAAWSLRRATSADVDALIDLLVALEVEVGDPLSDEGIPAFTGAVRRHLTSALPSGECVAWCAATGASLVSCALLTIHSGPPTPSNPDGRWAYLSRIDTAPEWRGRGIASALVAAALDFARAAGIPRVMLTATEASKPLYRRLGFRDFLGTMQAECL